MRVEAAQRHLDGDHRHLRGQQPGGEIQLPAQQELLAVGLDRRRCGPQPVAKAGGRGIDLVSDRKKVSECRIAVVAHPGPCADRAGLIQEILGILHHDGAQRRAGRGQRIGVGHDAVDPDALGERGSVEGLGDPSLAQRLRRRRRRVPDFDGPEMRAVGIGISNALQYRQIARLPRLHQRQEFFVQADSLIELDHPFARHTNGGPQFAVLRIGIRHERVQPVVAALEFDQQESPAHRLLLTSIDRSCRAGRMRRWRPPSHSH